jgi:ATP-dependent RNA helicase RhlE
MHATSFAELGLRPEILRAITESGYTTPTPIQAQAIPEILAGHDIMGGAQTGTGKTAGFGLPILQKLSQYANTSPSPARHHVRALIIAPTRELAIQVEEQIRNTASTRTCDRPAFGGVDRQQLAIVRAGVGPRRHAGTARSRRAEERQSRPGRDPRPRRSRRMLDMGFIPDIKRIMALLPAKRQSCCSPRRSPTRSKLADELSTRRGSSVARRNTAAETVSQKCVQAAAGREAALLVHLVKSRAVWQVLCFVRTKHGASRLARQLEKDGLATSAIHGDKTQAARLEALSQFKEGKLQVLVATDVAARGLDIDDMPLVVNYELPHVPEDYIHRIGRTGRAGATGEAISLVAPEEEKYLAEIEKLLKKKVTILSADGIDTTTIVRERPPRSTTSERTPRSTTSERSSRSRRPSGRRAAPGRRPA